MQLVKYPCLGLCRKLKPFPPAGIDKLKQPVHQMFSILHKSQGLGLAANQVGLPYRLFVMHIKGDPAACECVFINPVLSKPVGETISTEGCLSLPGICGSVARFNQITLSAYNLLGEKVTYDFSGLPAVIAQHECDHLDGILFIDRAVNYWKYNR